MSVWICVNILHQYNPLCQTPTPGMLVSAPKPVFYCFYQVKSIAFPLRPSVPEGNCYLLSIPVFSVSYLPMFVPLFSQIQFCATHSISYLSKMDFWDLIILAGSSPVYFTQVSSLLQPAVTTKNGLVG